MGESVKEGEESSWYQQGKGQLLGSFLAQCTGIKVFVKRVYNVIDMEEDPTVYTESFTIRLCSTAVEFDVKVSVSLHASMEFTFGGRSYNFRGVWIGHTGNRRKNKLVKGFHSYMPRDATAFGDVVDDASGFVMRMSTDQKIRVLVQVCKDIVACLDKILTEHMSSVVDYALWYRKYHPHDDDYSSLISLMTCNCIVNTDFMHTPRFELRVWQVVKF